jgi:hypothetical protein
MLAKELGRALEQVPVNLCKISRTVKYTVTTTCGYSDTKGVVGAVQISSNISDAQE